MTKTLTTVSKFKFMTRQTICRDHYELTRSQVFSLKAKLPRGIYWNQVQLGGVIAFNWTLLNDYLINGECPSHAALREEYLSTLPTAA
jgi:hypothetical protein